MIVRTEYDAPCGKLYLAATDDALCRACWHPMDIGEEGINDVLYETRRQLDEYFSGVRRDFDIPLCHAGYTAFQQKVWQVLKGIPYGTTISYKAEAEMLGNINAIRAVAQANALNPLCIFVPCHRVIGSNGRLTGYSGGLDKKRFLLEMESARLSQILSF